MSDNKALVDEVARLRDQRNFWVRQAMAFSEHADNLRLALLEPAPGLLCERGNHPAKPDSSPTLTDEEREAIGAGIEACDYGGEEHQEVADKLRALLKRLQ